KRWYCGGRNLYAVLDQKIPILAYRILTGDSTVFKRMYFRNGDRLDYRKSNLTLENPILKKKKAKKLPEIRIRNKFKVLETGDIEIELTQGKLAIVDPEGWEVVKYHRWSAAYFKNGQKWYAQTGTLKNGKQKIVHMHRMIMDFPPHETDHKDGDGLNNRISNLRRATRAENAKNRHARAKSNTGILNIRQYEKLNGKISYYVTLPQGIQKKFHDLVSAVSARNKALYDLGSDFVTYAYIEHPIYGRQYPGLPGGDTAV